eukprot:GHVQ01030306.1.p1 GENE.GHVQ01030306.1~~GHVQ01030306.1.p1  ORF type:complete len:375 (-),score=48.02 GHVQ01030306.1:338-1462(-)
MGLDDLFLHSFGGAAVTYFCIARELTFAPRIRLSICWIVVAWLLYMEVNNKEVNLYKILEITPSATKAEVHQAYRAASKTYHPDKNPDLVDAEGKFYQLKKAYDILSHDTLRSSYNRFGDHMEAKKDIDEKVIGMVVALAVVTQGLCFVMGYVLTFHKPLQFSRELFVMYNLAVFCVELYMRFVEEDGYADIPWFGQLLPFERVEILHQVFPAMLCLSMMLSNYLFVDEHSITTYLLRGVLASNRTLCDRIQQLTAMIPTAGSTSAAQATTVALKARLAGLKLPASTPLSPQAKVKGREDGDNKGKVTPPNSADEPVTKLQKFAAGLNEEQKAQFSELVTAPAREKSNTDTSSMKWSQVLLWGCVIFGWWYFKN